MKGNKFNISKRDLMEFLFNDELPENIKILNNHLRDIAKTLGITDEDLRPIDEKKKNNIFKNIGLLLKICNVKHEMVYGKDIIKENNKLKVIIHANHQYYLIKHKNVENKDIDIIISCLDNSIYFYYINKEKGIIEATNQNTVPLFGLNELFTELDIFTAIHFDNKTNDYYLNIIYNENFNDPYKPVLIKVDKNLSSIYVYQTAKYITEDDFLKYNIQ